MEPRALVMRGVVAEVAGQVVVDPARSIDRRVVVVGRVIAGMVLVRRPAGVRERDERGKQEDEDRVHRIDPEQRTEGVDDRSEDGRFGRMLSI